jgi:hypothetical protein
MQCYEIASCDDQRGRSHPSVVELDVFRFLPTLRTLRESQITESAVNRQHEVTIKALDDLRELVHPAKKK